MYRNTPPSNPYGQGVPQSGFDSSGYRSQMPRPRFQSSPRYHPQHGSPNPYFCGAGRGEFSSRGGHRSPRSFPSPRHEFVSPEQYGYDSPNSTFSPYLDRSMNQGQNNGNRNNSRGRGRYSSPGTRVYFTHNKYTFIYEYEIYKSLY